MASLLPDYNIWRVRNLCVRARTCGEREIYDGFAMNEYVRAYVRARVWRERERGERETRDAYDSVWVRTQPKGCIIKDENDEEVAEGLKSTSIYVQHRCIANRGGNKRQGTLYQQCVITIIIESRTHTHTLELIEARTHEVNRPKRKADSLVAALNVNP